MPRSRLILMGVAALALIAVLGWNISQRGPAPGFVSRDTFTPWPLSVESGQLRCNDGAVTFEANGTLYALNGTAKGLQTAAGAARYPPGEQLLRSDAQGTDLLPLIDRGLRLC